MRVVDKSAFKKWQQSRTPINNTTMQESTALPSELELPNPFKQSKVTRFSKIALMSQDQSRISPF